MDPLQFAYQRNRSVDDAILHVLNHVYSHLDKPGASIRLMFYDFSSALNTIQPHLLAGKLMQYQKVNAATFLWVLDYLTIAAHSTSNSVTPLDLMSSSLTRAHPREQSWHHFYSPCIRLTVDPLTPTTYNNRQVCGRHRSDWTDHRR